MTRYILLQSKHILKNLHWKTVLFIGVSSHSYNETFFSLKTPHVWIILQQQDIDAYQSKFEI